MNVEQTLRPPATLADLTGEHLDANMRAFWRPYGRVAGAEGEDAADFAWIFTGIPDRHLNRVLVIRPPAERVAAAVGRVARLSKERNGPTSWWLRRGVTPPEVRRLLNSRGARPLHDVPAMAAEIAGVPAVTPPPGVRIAEAVDRDDRIDFARTSAIAAGWSPAAVEGFARFEAGFGPEDLAGRFCFVARMDGRTVATTALALAGGVAGLYAVATLKDFQRRGIASALVAHALRFAADRGVAVALLQASPEGEPVYRRLGFGIVGWYDRVET